MIGLPAPDTELKDQNGKTVKLKDFKGHKTIVLFWNSGCGFCQQMLPDLKAFEANPPERSPKLVVVSSDSPEANKALGLQSPVLSEPQFAVGQAVGATGTPNVILVDERGNVGSSVVQGAPAVFELARSPQAQMT